MSRGIPIYSKNASSLDKPFFAKLKKHDCHKCGHQLKLAKINQLIKPGSHEIKGKSFRFDLMGNSVSYTFSIFECIKCGNKISIVDQYYIENPNKKNSVKYDDYHLHLQSLDRTNNGKEYEQYLQNLKTRGR